MTRLLLSKVLLVTAFALVIPSVARPALAARGRRPHHHRRHAHHHAPRHARHHAPDRGAQPHEL